MADAREERQDTGGDRRAGAPERGPERAPQRARDVERLAQLLDARFRVPGTSFRFGFDFLLGLIPVAGDVVTGGAGLWIVGRALALGAPASVIIRMVLNVLGDLALSVVPVAGDLADAAYKANLKNARLLQKHLESPEPTRRRSRAVVGLWVGALFLLFFGAAVVVALVLVALIQALTR